MASIRRYIEPPKWWSQELAEQTVPKYIKQVEKLFLDAGLVKSQIDNNMDTDNIILPTITNTSHGRNFCSEDLSFDFNDELQSELFIRITLRFGYYRRNYTGSDKHLYPRYHIVETIVKLIEPSTNGTISQKNVSSNFIKYYDSYNYNFNNGDDYKPHLKDSKSDSFITYKDGFFALCLNPMYGQSTQYTNDVRNSFVSLFTIERSFDDNGYTSDSINILGNYTYNGYKFDNKFALSTIILSKHSDSYATTSTMNYFSLPSLYNKGKIILYPIMYMDSKYNMRQSKNVIGVDSRIMNCGHEAKIFVEDEEVNFITTHNGESGDKTGYVKSGNCALMFRFE